MRKLLPVLLLTLLTGVVAAQTRHYDQVRHFSIELPAGWSPSTMQNADFAMSDGKLSLGVYTLNDADLASAVSRLAETYKKLGAKETLKQAITINEVPGNISVWEGGGEALLSTVLVSGQEKFLLLGTFPSGSSKTDAERMVVICKSFRVERGAAPVAAPPPSQPATPPPISQPPEEDQF
ncbi:MAG: hypothetical protein AB7S38_39370 [Vulcanimicrobiota bacterium]